MRLTKWLKTVFFVKKEACLENKKDGCMARNQSQPRGSSAMNTHSKFQLDALGRCRDTGVTKSCFSKVVNFSASSIISIKTDWYTLFRCGFRQKAWKTCLYHRCEYELDLTWSVEHVSVHSVVAYVQWLISALRVKPSKGQKDELSRLAVLFQETKRRYAHYFK